MALLGIVGELVDTMTVLPVGLRQMPDHETQLREAILATVTTLGEAIHQALDCVLTILEDQLIDSTDIEYLQSEIFTTDGLMRQFTELGILGRVEAIREQLAAILSTSGVELRWSLRRQLERLHEGLRERREAFVGDFGQLLQEVGYRGVGRTIEPALRDFLKDFRGQLTRDAKAIRQAMQQLKRKLSQPRRRTLPRNAQEESTQRALACSSSQAAAISHHG